MSSKDAAAGDGGVVGSIESKSSIPVSKVYALAPERSVLSHEKGDFAYFFNWKKRHEEFEKIVNRGDSNLGRCLTASLRTLRIWFGGILLISILIH